jgi:predicted nucleic acid-binding protein
MPAIANTSPIILLAKVGKLDLLSALYGEVVIPPAVAAELQAKPEAVSQELEHFLQSVEVRSPKNTTLVRALSVNLGAGEAEVIALGTEAPGVLVIMDDAEGRRVAYGLDLQVTGTLGVLVEGKARRRIPAIAPLLNRLLAEGLWLSERMRRTILDAVGE